MLTLFDILRRCGYGPPVHTVDQSLIYSRGDNVGIVVVGYKELYLLGEQWAGTNPTDLPYMALDPETHIFLRRAAQWCLENGCE